MAEIYIIDVDDTYIEWYVYGLSSYWNTSNYVKVILALNRVAIDGQSTPPINIISEHNAPSSGSNYYTAQYTDVHGMSAGEDRVYAVVYTPGSGQYYNAGSALITVPSGTPTLDTPTLDTAYTQKTHNTISVRSNSVTNAVYYRIELWNSAKTTMIDYVYSTSRIAGFSGLSAGTQYQIRIKVSASGYNDSAWSSWYAATTTVASGWNWQHSTLPDDLFAVTRTEWLAFQAKINEIRVGRGYAAYTFTTSIAEIYAGKPFKAAHMNEAINAINTMLSSANDMSTVSAGDEITSAFMISIKDKLNSCIV